MNPNEVVYVGNIPKQATNLELAEFFKDVGTVVKVSFMRENRNDCRTKVGFVLFENEAQAKKACNFDQTIFQWNRVIVTLVNDERHFWAGHTVVVRNLAFEINEEELYEAFGRYGMIEAVQIPTNNFAYVGFKDKSAANAAQRLNNTILGSTKITVQVLNRNVRVRLEDFDSFKTPRVYNELMDAKMKHTFSKGHAALLSTQPKMSFGNNDDAYDLDDDDDDDEDNRVYDPVTNQFYNKVKDIQVKREPLFDQEQEEDMFFAPPSTVTWNTTSEKESNNVTSSNKSPTWDILGASSAEETHESPEEIRRREVQFTKHGITSPNKNAVRVENIPRDVYDEDVVKYFDQFGPIISVEIGFSQSCIFTKIYTVVFEEESTAERVLDCFMRKCEFSGVVCTVFTMRPDETLLEVPGKAVLIDYISNSVVYEDVVEAFSKVGVVIYVKKTHRNTTPTVVHFLHSISIDRAKQITKLDGDKVQVVPFSHEAFRTFTSEYLTLKKASSPHTKKPLKNVRMMDIEMKEQTEKVKSVILRTVFNPSYRSPNPALYTYEVVIYNCPARITLKDLRHHFINVAFVSNMRYEQSMYDKNTWKVFASFPTFIEAFNAVRLKGLLATFPIYKHLATEKPKLDSQESILIECEQGDISVSKMHSHLISHGAMAFVDKVDHNKFIAVCRESKTAKKLVSYNWLAKPPCKIAAYRDVINRQNALVDSLDTSLESQNMSVQHQGLAQFAKGQPLHSKPPISLADILSLQKPSAESQTSWEQHRGSQHATNRSLNEWEQDDDHVLNNSRLPNRNAFGMGNVAPNWNRNNHQPFIPGNQRPPLERVDDLAFANPPAPSGMLLALPPRDFQPGWAFGGPMHRPPAMVPPPVTRTVFMPERISLPTPPGCGVLGAPFMNPAGPPLVAAQHPVPQEGDLRQYLAEKRNIRPREIYDPVEAVDHQPDEASSAKPSSTSKEVDLLETYIRNKERDIKRRLEQLDKDILTSRKSREPRGSRSVSPTDRKAHQRIESIRKEKIEITRQMSEMLRLPNYRTNPRFTSLAEKQSSLDKEDMEIKRQLDAKKLWLAERERSLSSERHQQEAEQRNSRRSRSRSRSPNRRRDRSPSYNRDRSFSRSRERFRRSSRSSSRGARRSGSREKINRRGERVYGTRRSRSHSFERGRRSASGDSFSSRYDRSDQLSKRNAESLMREMRQLGRRQESKHDHCVYVGNIADTIKTNELKGTFDRYGRVVDFDTSLREKYGEIYVEYHQREDAFKALEMNRVKIWGKRLRVALNCRKPCNREGYSVIVELPEPVPERDLYARFDACGEIEFIWHYEGFTMATITFEKPESMLLALGVRELRNGIPIIVREYIDTEH
ncbi:uncharacterized protein LOC128743793 [Sabethes cyaneus]|uniref:uncharacterized protein LOC128743793 n=1 Tax=Sabethes cyaneus TaxID=53552 RepID=UPI00237EC85E|nr:uncharacterized protein LOC128743793 [Sabethes cyaneus]XP_053696445.1 uncharacterized protein LOC128743793 [Sabethes cyaneus]